LFKMLCKVPPKPREIEGRESMLNKTDVKLEKIDFSCGKLSKGSVIIYCWRKKDCEALCEQVSGGEGK